MLECLDLFTNGNFSLSLPLSFFLDLQLNKQFSVFPSAAAPTPSLGNVAASDLSFFDAYAPASTPAQNQVMHSASEDFSISQV